MSLFGMISPFNLHHGDFSENVERLEQYFVANNIAKALEGIEKETKMMGSSTCVKENVKNEDIFQERRREFNARKCYRCGDEKHLANMCIFKNTVCSVCRMTGHIAKSCRNKDKVGRSSDPRS